MLHWCSRSRTPPMDYRCLEASPLFLDLLRQIDENYSSMLSELRSIQHTLSTWSERSTNAQVISDVDSTSEDQSDSVAPVDNEISREMQVFDKSPQRDACAVPSPIAPSDPVMVPLGHWDTTNEMILKQPLVPSSDYSSVFVSGSALGKTNTGHMSKVFEMDFAPPVFDAMSVRENFEDTRPHRNILSLHHVFGLNLWVDTGQEEMAHLPWNCGAPIDAPFGGSALTISIMIQSNMAKQLDFNRICETSTSLHASSTTVSSILTMANSDTNACGEIIFNNYVDFFTIIGSKDFPVMALVNLKESLGDLACHFDRALLIVSSCGYSFFLCVWDPGINFTTLTLKGHTEYLPSNSMTQVYDLGLQWALLVDCFLWMVGTRQLSMELAENVTHVLIKAVLFEMFLLVLHSSEQVDNDVHSPFLLEFKCTTGTSARPFVVDLVVAQPRMIFHFGGVDCAQLDDILPHRAALISIIIVAAVGESLTYLTLHAIGTTVWKQFLDSAIGIVSNGISGEAHVSDEENECFHDIVINCMLLLLIASHGEVVVIFARYNKPMQLVISSTDGFHRSVTKTSQFSNFSSEDLAIIFHLKLKKQAESTLLFKFAFRPSCSVDTFAPLFKAQNTTNLGGSFLCLGDGSICYGYIPNLQKQVGGELLLMEGSSVLKHIAANIKLIDDVKSIKILTFRKSFPSVIEESHMAAPEDQRVQYIEEKEKQDMRSAVIRAEGEVKSSSNRMSLSSDRLLLNTQNLNIT